MSALPRYSRSRSHSPKHSPSSSKPRRPLHERSDSDTNAALTATTSDFDDTYRKSPFPRLPSQILIPKGDPLIFEDATATAPLHPNVTLRPTARDRAHGDSAIPRPRHSPRASRDRGRGRLITGANSPIADEPLPDLPPPNPLGQPRKTPLADAQPWTADYRPAVGRSKSRVRSIVSRIEAARARAESSPPTPRTPRTPRSRTRGPDSPSLASVASDDAEDAFSSMPLQTPILEAPHPTLLSNSLSLSQPDVRSDQSTLEANPPEPEQQQPVVVPASIPQEAAVPRRPSDVTAEDFPAVPTSRIRPPSLLNTRIEEKPRDVTQVWSPRTPPLEPTVNEPINTTAPHQSAPHAESEVRELPHRPASATSDRPSSGVQDQILPSDDAPPSSSNSPEFAEQLPERPRSSSAPLSVNEDYLQTLIANGTQIQYPRLHRPSINSLGTDTSSLRRAVPQPLRLQRKQGHSQLAQAANEDSLSSATESHELHHMASDDAISYQDLPETQESQQMDSTVSGRWTPGRWTSELEDTVAELNPHQLRSQRSYYREPSLSESRPVSVSSVASSASGGFYRFLNDSRTAWAKSYYKNEGSLRLQTPPHVSALLTPERIRASFAARARSNSTLISGPTSSPDSVEYPEAIYIPRARPLLRRISTPMLRPHIERRAPPEVDERDEMAIEPASYYAPTQMVMSQRPQTPDQPTSYNATAEIPHLSPDRHNSLRISEWRAPSIEQQSVFGPVNRQITLFCVGFIFPFAWIVAAFLPIVEPPGWDNEKGQDAQVQEAESAGEVARDSDVRRYQKARWWRNFNRFMSIAGICVIAAVIALAIVGTRQW